MLNMQNVKDIEITEGNVRTIHDKDDRLIWGRLAYDTKYAGDTFQQTYSGKNLLEGTPWRTVVTSSGYPSYIGTGITINSSDNNNIDFTSTENYRGVESNYIQIANGTTITVSFTGTLPNRLYVTQYDSDKTRVSTLNPSVTTVGIITVTTTQDGYITVAFANSTSGSFTISNVQMEVGSSATSYEPYVGGIPAPNPDYPQDVQVVNGEQTVNVHGKNLLNASTMEQGNFSYINNYESANNSIIRSGFFACEPNTKYTLSLNEEIGEIGVIYKDSGGNLIQGFGNNSTNKYFTFTTKADTVQMRIRVGSGSYPKTIGVDYKLMVEQSDSPTTYEPYQSQDYTVDLGSIELCKIGDYQDYIYKSGDDWYVHKEFVKYYLSDFTFSMESNASNYRIVYQTQLLDLQKPASNDDLPIALCSHYRTATALDTWRSVQGICMSQSSRLYIYDNSYNQSSSANDYNSWIQDNKPSLFWKLATPTDTKITDATLVGQLNAVHEWLTRYGYNSTVTGNLPLIINQTNL